MNCRACAQADISSLSEVPKSLTGITIDAYNTLPFVAMGSMPLADESVAPHSVLHLLLHCLEHVDAFLEECHGLVAMISRAGEFACSSELVKLCGKYNMAHSLGVLVRGIILPKGSRGTFPKRDSGPSAASSSTSLVTA